ncbi:LOW QUALITY PROTEIN: uncharacterized protein apol [Spinachia spinachia]
MSAARQALQEAMCCYINDTLIYISTVREFCERVQKWALGRKTELLIMKDIKERADNVDYVAKSENKFKAFFRYLGSKITQATADSRRAELEAELAAVLRDTVGGLEKLHCFLDAVENLAVTSLPVFEDKNSMLHLPDGILPEDVQAVVSAARMTFHLLINFRRDDTAFFLPKLHNVEVLSYQLNMYLESTQTICAKLDKSCLVDFCIEMNDETLVDLDVYLSDDDIKMMRNHIEKLDEIRMNQSFRTVFLFQGECSNFLFEIEERMPGMLQFLDNLEENAVQLDRMNKGAKISSVVGSSVGAAGSVITIVGLALIPVTAGASLALTTEWSPPPQRGVNQTQQKQARETFKRFMEDVGVLQDSLEKVSQKVTDPNDVVVEVGMMLGRVGAIGKSIDGVVDVAAAIKLLKSEDLVAGAGKVAMQEGKALRNVPKVAADLPDIGQVAVKGPLALSNSARAGLIGLNAFFLGMDIFFICKDSISLAKGCKTEVSQSIRARAALWRSELDSWQRIYDFLAKGLPTSKKNKTILDAPFYPEKEMKEHGKELQLKLMNEKLYVVQ